MQFVSAPSGHQTAAALKAEIEKLQVQIMADHQLKFRANPEPQQAEKLLTELLEMTADLMGAREAIARLNGKLIALRSQRSSCPWWLRMLTG